jgi:hypothetical protein
MLARDPDYHAVMRSAGLTPRDPRSEAIARALDLIHAAAAVAGILAPDSPPPPGWREGGIVGPVGGGEEYVMPPPLPRPIAVIPVDPDKDFL